MTTPNRWWKATVNTEGELMDVRQVPYVNEEATGTEVSTYGEHYVAWAKTREEAIKKAREAWERGQD